MSLLVARLAPILVLALSFACSHKSPSAPTAADGVGTLAARPDQPAPGTYLLSFHVLSSGVLQPVTTLPVLSDELILKAEVRDSSGVPAPSGSILFEYCSYKKLPPNDITRADEAPTAACDAGLATWDRLGSSEISAGTATWTFDIVRIPRTVGFRFRFPRRGGDIAEGIGGPADFTWTAN